MNFKKRPRISDVARLAGVSDATVSVVLNNRVGESARVSQETQRKIWAAVRELGYVANPLARSLAGGRNHIIAVFTFEPVFPLEHGNFYYPFLIGIEEQAARQGYDLLLVTSSSDDDSGKRTVYRGGVNRLRVADGAILLGFGHRHEVLNLLNEGYPFVFVGRRESPGDRISYVAGDYASATADIVQSMFQHGHRRIAYLQSTDDNEATRDRKEGYDQAHRQAGLTADPNLYRIGDADKLTADLLGAMHDDGVTAFIVENDLLGARILTLTNSLGLSCPQDFSLAVLGDPLSMLAPDYTWTTFKVPRREMGAEAVRLLIQVLQSNPEEQSGPYRCSLPCSVVPGNTIGPCPT